MNLQNAAGLLRSLAFRLLRGVVTSIPAGKTQAFGTSKDKIGSILVINLDRQPQRWRRIIRELRRFRTADGVSLVSITRRLVAIDARDGRAVAAATDIDPLYRMKDQLFVEPDPRLEACFGLEEQIRMTRQEVAVARSHIEAWKTIAAGNDSFVLVLEDDVWFRQEANVVIDRGWQEALQRGQINGGPHLLYLSYKDALGVSERTEVGDTLFRPQRGLWYLSGYILSREGAATLLRAMPVVGPVDLWVNYRLIELDALALNSPVILQRCDSGSDNSYSILPYLARAGIVDAGTGPIRPWIPPLGLVFSWTAGSEHESLAMAFSMLGLRVRVFDDSEERISIETFETFNEDFDVLVDAPLAAETLFVALARTDTKFILEEEAIARFELDVAKLPRLRTIILLSDNSNGARPWKLLCDFIGLAEPIQAFPVGASRSLRLFRDDRLNSVRQLIAFTRGKNFPPDDSPWVLPVCATWQPQSIVHREGQGASIATTAATGVEPYFKTLVETFPGNLALFSKDGLIHDGSSTKLVISKSCRGSRRYSSGAFASVASFRHGHFEAEIKAASGSGLMTGFFLYRSSPRQEIDIELPGKDPQCMLVNVYFNPGDEGASMNFGYRGSPHGVALGFDSTLDFHHYAIDWQPGYIAWSVDGNIVHERVGWDPTPIPHLPMCLYANLWAPRSEELVGRIDNSILPATTTIKNISVLSY